MKLARVAVVGVALAAGGIAAILALNLTRRESPPEPTPQVEAILADQVLVASKDIPMGTTLSEASIQWQEWPKSGVTGRFIVRSSASDLGAVVVGAIARASFYQGEPITDSKLIRSDRGFMSAILPGGKRAVATKISADTSAGGFILPNDRVDVIMTRRSDRDDVSGDNQFITETILNNLRVLAIDQTIEDQNGEKVVVGQTATLELSPQQAEILTVAQQMSDRLTLALRSIKDATPSPADAASDALHLIGGTKRNGAVIVVKSGVAREVVGIR
ncbi:MAG: Flp pilus assembly protein CpaB [Bauldia sp.]